MNEVRARVQWKGTDLCMDFDCECGRPSHFDGFFAYAVTCVGCGAIWRMPEILVPTRVTDQAEAANLCIQHMTPCWDEEDEATK